MTGQAIQDLGVYALGEDPEDLQVTMKGADGNPLDLSAFSLGVAIEAIEGTPAANLGGGSVSENSGGLATYNWHVDDFAAVGTFRLQIWGTDGTNTIASEVFQYAVEQVTTKPVL